MASDLVLLRSFIAVYRATSITKAAPDLHLTQPAVSAHIKALEAQLGRGLFTRTAKGVSPTQAAHDLARTIAPHVDALDIHFETARAGGGVLAGTLYVGGPAEFLAAKVLPTLALLCDQGIGLRIDLGLPEPLIEKLADGVLDLVIATRKVPRRGIEYRPLFTETFVLVGSPRWAAEVPRQERGHTDGRALAQIPHLAYSGELPILERYYREVFGMEVPEPTVLVPDLRSVVAVAVAGAGIAAVPRYLCDEHIARGALVELVTPATAPTNVIHLAWKSGGMAPRRAAAIDLLKRVARSW